MQLYDYQKNILERGIKILDTHKIIYLALEMRLGKSPIAIHLIAHTHKTDEDTSLFITKKKAVQSIQDDINALQGSFLGQIEVINYESLHKISEKKFKCIVLDEAHTCGTYPKPTKIQKAVNSLFTLNPGANAILLSGTPNIESHSQLYAQLRITNKFFTEYKSFYSWFKDYGIPNQIMVRGRMVNTYKDTRSDLISEKVRHLFITCTQAEADFKVKSILKPVYLDNPFLAEWVKSFSKNQVHYFDSFTVAADGAAAVLSKSLQVCGGVVLADDDKPYILPDTFLPYVKLDWVKSSLNKYAKTCIFTNFKSERSFLKNQLDDSTFDMEEFKTTAIKYFIGSLESYSEGFDLSKISNLAIVIYSLSWKGKVLAQAMERQNNKLRTEPIDIYLPIIKDTPEVDLYNQVAVNKRNFNSTFYNDIK
jgi:hypothetical protein